MLLQIEDNLPFISAFISYRGESIEIPHVLIDTGSATSIFSADLLSKIKILPEPEDILYTIRGVGGFEAVFTREVDIVRVGDMKMGPFQIEVGGVDYGFNIEGILGMDFLIQSSAVIDLQARTIYFRKA